MLWAPCAIGRRRRSRAHALGPVWELLNIKEPHGEREKIPLGVYSLTYPKMPLLMIDFRNSAHLKWHELTQRTITEITSGVIGISRFTNWYYYVAADLYDFYASRRGTATNQQQRARMLFQISGSIRARPQHGTDVARRHVEASKSLFR
jgi:hypothetical protein